LGNNCTFIAERTVFEGINEKDKWGNITLTGKIKGYIKSCIFKNGQGRSGKEVYNLSNYDSIILGNERERKTYGGALFIYSTEGDYLISSCQFENCSASKGGGVYCFGYLNTLIGNTFYNCRPNNCGGECSC
jgi:hypothetical protein